ncbi:hypothetical protein D3C78_1242220 [compost metagenome]
MAVGSTRDDAQTTLRQHLCQRLRIGDDLAGIVGKFRTQGLAESHGLGGDDVHQGAALIAGEDGRVQLLRQIGVIGKDHAAAGAAQGLVGGGGDDMGVRHRVRIFAAGDQTGIMGHVDHQISADFVGYSAEAGKIDLARIGRCARHDQLRLGLQRPRPHLLHIDQMCIGIDLIGDDIEPLAGHRHRRTVGQVAAMGK